MSVKAFITDLHGTLLNNDGSIVSGFDTALAQLHDMGLKIVVFSNQPHSLVDTAIGVLPITPDLVLTKQDTGIAKGSPLWIDRVCSIFNIRRNDTVYIGDSNHDMYMAANAGIVYLNAEWATPNYPYGIPISNPVMLAPFVKHFLMKSPLWYWLIDSYDRRGNRVISRALIRHRDIGIGNFKSQLKAWIKDNNDCQLGMFSMSEFITYHLLGSLYLDGTYSTIDSWCIVPGHAGGHNPSFDDSLQRISRLFKDKFIPNLLHRHTAAPKLAYRRFKGEPVCFREQVSTICLDCQTQEQKKLVEGKTILVIDDFVTSGLTTEWARNLLYNAGAEQVISVAIGAFHTSIESHTVSPEIQWDSYKPIDIEPTYLEQRNLPATLNLLAIEPIKQSYIELTT